MYLDLTLMTGSWTNASSAVRSKAGPRSSADVRAFLNSELGYIWPVPLPLPLTANPTINEHTVFELIQLGYN